MTVIEAPANTAYKATKLASDTDAVITIDPEHIPTLPAQTVLLDLGSGQADGYLLDYLREKNPAAEISSIKLDYFADNLKNRKGRRVVADAIALPFRDDSFAVVTSSELTKDNPYLSFSPEHLSSMASEIGRVLKPGGLYIVYNEAPVLMRPPGLQTIYEMRHPQRHGVFTFSGLLYGVYRKPLK